MPNQTERLLMIENLQDSLRLVRHLMKLSVENFAEAIGVTAQTVNELETKKSQMSATQYIATAALIDTYFAQNEGLFIRLRAILDSDGKNYGAEYETAFRDDSLLKRWFENVLDFTNENFSDAEENPLTDLVHEYKIFLDAQTLTEEDAETFVKFLTAALLDAKKKIIVPLRSIEELGEASHRAKNFLAQMQAAGVLQIHGEEDDPDFRDTILSVFEKFRGKYRLCLVTPSEFLAHEVLRLNDSAEDSDFEIVAGFFDEGEFKFYELYDAPEPNEVSTEEMEGWTEL